MYRRVWTEAAGGNGRFSGRKAAEPMPSSRSFSIANNRADAYYTARNYDAAAQVVREFLAEAPTHPRAIAKLARIHCAARQFDQAAEALREYNCHVLADDTGRLLNYFLSVNHAEGAAIVLGRMLVLGRVETDEIKVVILTAKHAGKPGLAANAIIDALPLCRPRFQPHVCSMALNAFRDADLLEEAEQVFRKAEQMEIVDEYILNSMLAAYAVKNRVDEAEAIFERIGSRATAHTYASVMGLYGRSMRTGRAEALFEEAWAKFHDSYLVTAMMGAYYRSNNPDKAERTYDRGIAGGVSNAAMHSSLIGPSMKVGRQERAVEAYRTARNKDETDARLFCEVVRSFPKGSERDEATQLLGRACLRERIHPMDMVRLLQDLRDKGDCDEARAVIRALPLQLAKDSRIERMRNELEQGKEAKTEQE